MDYSYEYKKEYVSAELCNLFKIPASEKVELKHIFQYLNHSGYYAVKGNGELMENQYGTYVMIGIKIDWDIPIFQNEKLVLFLYEKLSRKY